jgi:hypothetical protein
MTVMGYILFALALVLLCGHSEGNLDSCQRKQWCRAPETFQSLLMDARVESPPERISQSTYMH